MSSPIQPSRPKPLPKPVLPPSRIVFLVFVVAAVAVIAMELRARFSWDATYKAVDKAFVQGEESNKGLHRDEVKPLLRGSFSRQTEKSGAEVYTWRGVLQSYQMRVEYDSAGYVTRLSQPGREG